MFTHSLTLIARIVVRRTTICVALLHAVGGRIAWILRPGITKGPVGGIPSVKRDRRFVVVVGGVDNVDNAIFAALVRKNGIPKVVEELSTYPHSQWIIGTDAEIVGMRFRVLR